MGKNVAVFVDVANIFYAAKAAGVDIDYVTLLKSATAGRDLVRAYAYTGLDPDNENQRNFHDFLRRSNYKVVSKDIRKYGDGKVKANLDIELVVDMMKTARNLDIAIVVSGDGDFAPAIRAVQEQGVRVEVISFRGNTSSDLIDVADQFTDIVQLARVEKGSRSGRRVAEDDADLSMTEVPDKLTEGSGTGRGGRGRGRGRTTQEEPIAIGRGRGRGRTAVEAPAAAVSAAGAAGLVALPGERLSRSAGALSEADLASAEVFTLDDAPDGDVAAEPAGLDGQMDDGEPRRRRRRGGRGRGRGRGRPEELEGQSEAPPREVQEPVASLDAEEEEEDLEIAPARRAPRSTPFGSVWDSQLGTPTSAPAASLTPLSPVGDDEDFDEPEIPEYLIAEQRRGANRGPNRGARGGRSAYQSAMERERYGRGGAPGGGGGGGGSRGGSGGGRGINRYPDVSARPRPSEAPRPDRGYGRTERAPMAPRNSSEPWSDVPPELEALLRAQVAQKPVAAGTRPGSDRPPQGTDAGSAVEPDDTEPVATVASKPRATRKPSGRSRAAAAIDSAGTGEDVGTADALAPAEGLAPPKRRTTRTPKAAATSVQADAPVEAETAAPATKLRAARKASVKATAASTATTADVGSDATDAEVGAAAPKRRATRKAATPKTA